MRGRGSTSLRLNAEHPLVPASLIEKIFFPNPEDYPGTPAESRMTIKMKEIIYGS